MKGGRTSVWSAQRLKSFLMRWTKKKTCVRIACLSHNCSVLCQTGYDVTTLKIDFAYRHTWKRNALPLMNDEDKISPVSVFRALRRRRSEHTHDFTLSLNKQITIIRRKMIVNIEVVLNVRSCEMSGNEILSRNVWKWDICGDIDLQQTEKYLQSTARVKQSSFYYHLKYASLHHDSFK